MSSLGTQTAHSPGLDRQKTWDSVGEDINMIHTCYNNWYIKAASILLPHNACTEIYILLYWEWELMSLFGIRPCQNQV